MPTTSRVSAGLRFSKVSPDADSTHSPSMKFLYTLGRDASPSITDLVRVSVAIDILRVNLNATARSEDGQVDASVCFRVFLCSSAAIFREATRLAGAKLAGQESVRNALSLVTSVT